MKQSYLLLITTIAILLFSCQKDEPLDTVEVLNFQLEIDTLYYDSSHYVSSDNQIIDTIPFSYSISQTGTYTVSVNGIIVYPSNENGTYNGSFKIADVINQDTLTTNNGKITTTIYNSIADEVIFSKTEIITLIPKEELFTVSNPTFNVDTLYFLDNEFYTASCTPIDSIYLSVTISAMGRFSTLLHTTEKPLKSEGSSYSASFPIKALLNTDTITTPFNNIPLKLFSPNKTLVLDTTISLTTIEKNSLINAEDITTNPATIVYTNNTYYTTSGKPLNSITFTVKGDFSIEPELSINATKYNTIKTDTSLSVTIPISTLINTANSSNNISSILTLYSNGEVKGYCDTVLIEVLSHLPEPYDEYSWHIRYSGNNFSDSHNIDKEAHVSLSQAWKMTRGAGITVAIIDQGFEADHEDLTANVAGTYNAKNESTDVFTGSATSQHGTTCAGIVASPVNSLGISGTAPDAKLLLIAVDDLSDAFLIKAFEYAQSQGAKVISCSWGSYNVSQPLADKLKELYDAGIVTVFAAGNDLLNLDNQGINDESELETVIGVIASDEKNDIASYSNYGSNVEFLAPGGSHNIGILGTDLMGSQGDNNLKKVVDNNYTFSLGTSFSAPIVSGVAALVLSVDPSLTPAEVRTILINSCDKIGASAHYNQDGFDTKRAYGKINAAKAVSLAASYRFR